MDRHIATEFLRRFGISLWGACVGAFVAALVTGATIAVRGDTHDQPHAGLLPSAYLSPYEMVPWQEKYEHMWYVLTCVAGAGCGWVAVRFVRPSPWLAALSAVAVVPAVAAACHGV